MKKIITLLFSIGAFTFSFAQYNHQQNNDDRNYRSENNRGGYYANSSDGYRNFDRDDRNQGNFYGANIFSAREKDFQVEKINRDFIFRVKEIQNDCYLGHREKRAAIRDAEFERSKQIGMVINRFNCNR